MIAVTCLPVLPGPACIARSAALALVLLLAGCRGSQAGPGGACLPPEGTPAFRERGPEAQPGDSSSTDAGTVLAYVRHGVAGGEPLSGAIVALYPEGTAGDDVQLADGARTDVIGLAMIERVPARRYRVEIRRIGYFPVTGMVQVRPGYVHIIDAALAMNRCRRGR